MFDRATKNGGGAIDVADDAVREDVVTVADMARPRISRRRGHADPVEELKPNNAGVVLADSGIVHDHRPHRPFGRVEGVVTAAIRPGDDDMRAVLREDVRATGYGQDSYVVVRGGH